MSSKDIQKEILSIIPARGGSKGVPRKNIKELNGKPLINYTIQASLQSEYITRTIVSTENSEIAQVSQDAGAEIPFIRPSKLAEDEVPTLPVLQHCLQWLSKEESCNPSIVVLMHPTSPLRTFKHVDEAIKIFFNTEANSVVSVCEVEHTPYWFKTINEEGKIHSFMSDERDYDTIVRQKPPKVYRLNGAIYVNKKEVIVNEGRHYKKNARAYVMSQKNSVDIDTPLDFKLAQMFIEQKDNW